MKPEVVTKELMSKPFFGSNSCMVLNVSGRFNAETGRIRDSYVGLSIRRPIATFENKVTKKKLNKYFEFDRNTGKAKIDRKNIQLSESEVHKILLLIQYIITYQMNNKDFNQLVEALKNTDGLNNFNQFKLQNQNKIEYEFFRDKKTEDGKPKYKFIVNVLPPNEKYSGVGIAFNFVSSEKGDKNEKPDSYVFIVRDIAQLSNILSYITNYDNKVKNITSNTPERYFYEEQFRQRMVNKEIIIQKEELLSSEGVVSEDVVINPEEEISEVPVVETEDAEEKLLDDFLNDAGYVKETETKAEESMSKTESEEQPKQQKETYYGEKGKGTFSGYQRPFGKQGKFTRDNK